MNIAMVKDFVDKRLAVYHELSEEEKYTISSKGVSYDQMMLKRMMADELVCGEKLLAEATPCEDDMVSVLTEGSSFDDVMALYTKKISSQTLH